MADFARKHGLDLRPHAKSHKSADIARAQLTAGAVGLCCAKLGEAEALAAEGIDGLHLTSPVVTAPAIARLAALSRRMSSVSVVADHRGLFAAQDPPTQRTGLGSLEEEKGCFQGTTWEVVL